MTEQTIVAVWGTADNHELIYTQKNGKWETNIPPDFSDGTYAVEVFAENQFGKIGHWTGFLYMHNGKACLHLNQPRFMLWFCPDNFEINATNETVQIVYVGSCIHRCSA